MNIICAGIPRSGSTRLYSILRLGLEQNFPLNEISSQWEAAFKVGDHHNLLKIHNFSKKWLDWSDFVFTTKRDLRYIAASAIDLMPAGTYKTPESLVQMCKDILIMYDSWNEHSDYELVYEDFYKNETKIVDDIFKVLNLKVDIEKLLFELKEIKNSNLNFDHTTLMHKNHISKNTGLHYTKRLSKEQYEIIEKEFKDWLICNKYIISKPMYI